MSSNKSGRVLAVATLAAALFLAVPAQAIDGRGTPLGFLERLTAWFVEIWMPADAAGGAGGRGAAALANDPQPPVPHPTDGEGDPEGCRGDYTACIDPNG